jgi:hypothetical protein
MTMVESKDHNFEAGSAPGMFLVFAAGWKYPANR